VLEKESEMVDLTNSVPMPKLTKEANYDNWSLKMKSLFSQETWKVVENGFEESTNNKNWSNVQLKALKEARVKDKATLYIMYQVVDESDLEKIASDKCSKEV